jgi:geranylgeranylglycerol-phosphate geranylgeranyltransferase
MPPPQVPWWSPRFVRAYVVTMRPYLLFISGAAGLVGISFTANPSTGRVLLAFVPLFLSYGLGQALTDCFQTDTDSISAPYRPLVRGVVSRRQVLAVSLTGLTAVVLVLAYLNPAILILGVLAVVGLLTYTSLKRTWWGGPPWNAWIVALLPLMGRLTEHGYSLPSFGRPEGPHAAAFAASVLAVFLGYANFVVMGYMKDISADRATGYRTFPVVFGWRPAVLYGDATAAGAMGLTARALALVGANPWSLAMFATGFILHVSAQSEMHLTTDESRTGRPISNGVRALILYCLAIVAANRVEWAPLLVVFYGLFELVLRGRPEEGQV